MSSYVKIIYNRLDFLEFKQNIMFLKLPHHKADIFVELNIDDFIKIRDFTLEFQKDILMGKRYNIRDYEKEINSIWPKIKSFPYAIDLVAKALMQKTAYETFLNN